MSADVTARAVVEELRFGRLDSRARKGTTTTPSRRAGHGVRMRSVFDVAKSATGCLWTNGNARHRADLRGPDGGLQHPRLQGPSDLGSPILRDDVPAAPRPDHRLGHVDRAAPRVVGAARGRVVRRAPRARNIAGALPPPTRSPPPSRSPATGTRRSGRRLRHRRCPLRRPRPSVHKARHLLAHAANGTPPRSSGSSGSTRLPCLPRPGDWRRASSGTGEGADAEANDQVHRSITY